MTKKAFLFDLDGVLIYNEPLWNREKAKMYTRLFGAKIAGQMGQTMGMHQDAIYDRAHELGAQLSKQDLLNAFAEAGPHIYDEAPMMQQAAELGDLLRSLGYVMGIVSSSPSDWVNRVVRRMPFRDDLQLVLALHDHAHIAQKPAPDGYLHAMQQLGAIPESTIILEDSNSGITAARASGAFTITYSAHLPKGYPQMSGDAFAATTQDVMDILMAREHAGTTA